MAVQNQIVKLLLLCFQTVLAITAAERRHGAKAGPVKKKEVMLVVESQAKNLNVAEEEGSCRLDELLLIVDELIDSLVALFNCFGFLSRSGLRSSSFGVGRGAED